ncbi:MAG TPA: cytosine deaminase [Candidatus Alistipes intestinipullorum]|nr:cytosine deaminase [Candidatus Alistipes intestinipullorum]
MNSSEQPPVRRIASNRLWTPQGVVRWPLVTLSAEGRMLSVEECSDPDRRAGTEFYAGLLVFGFPADYRRAFAELISRSEEPLMITLPLVVLPEGGIPVVLSGLDYATLRLTPHAQVRPL